MNYDKYRYEQQKKKREQQKKSAASRMDLKELKMGYNIDVHDYSVRLRAAQKFLKDGDKVKVIVNLKGRGNAFLEKAVQLIRKFQTELGECVAKDCPLCNGLLLLVCCVLIANCFLKTGEPQIICRPLGLRRKMVVCLELMLLTEAWSSAALYISAIVVMDPGKCIAVSDNKLNCQVDKLTMKISSSIDVLGPKQCEALEINGVSILCLDIKFKTEAAKCPKVDHIFSGLLQIHHVTDIRVCIDFC
ncbi:hypothetical protein BVRB_3g050380 [Beta vulgaris subsp. vulgaris]|uniref:Translation initiation factor 3 C-terminal domain-containing protein n=1 Tax=Beta vulgaris subsp. vulgaris TaxID=3555 RepID=A0A0J8CWD5_BETVV|nr:hypothetical protein BVRB_3g050380 [Beta vulgaris subsp. vulgaris]